MLTVGMLGSVFVLVALTFALLFASGFRADPDGAPARSAVIDGPLPLLFYVLAVLCIVLRKADLLMVALAWAFVIVEVLGAVLARDGASRRVSAGLVAAVVLLAMWAVFAVRILFEV